MEKEQFRSKKYRRREICLLFVVGLFSVVIFILATLLIIKVHKDTSFKEVCTNKACTMTASSLISSMDFELDPCKDFYKFACDGFIRKNLVPENSMELSNFLIFHDKQYLMLRDVIENTYSVKEEPGVVFKVQEVYHVCMNISFNEKEEIDAFRKFENDILDQWPLGNGSQWEAKTSTEEFLGKLEHFGLKNYLFDVVMIPKLENQKEYIIAITGPIPWDILPFQLPKTKEDDSKIVHSKYSIETITKYANFFGNRNESDIKLETKELIKFEKEISQVEVNLTDFDEFVLKAQRMTIQDFNNITCQQIDWLKLLNVAFDGSHTFNENDVIEVVHMSYLQEICKIISNFSERTLRNFIGFENLKRIAYTVEPLIEKVLSEFDSMDSKTNKSRWKFCLTWLDSLYPLVLTRLFIQKYVNDDGKTIIDDLIKFVQIAYMDAIKESKWLDETTKERALLKAQKMRRMIAYPELIFDKKALEEEYEHISDVESSFLLNAIRLRALTTQRNQKFLNFPIDHNKWKFSPLEINAFYDFTSNAICLPSGILQMPFFETSRLAAVNFGMIGSIIGHEIGHGFDDKGCIFDEMGRKKQWWEERTFERYKARTACFKEQYDEYCPEQLRGGENDTGVCVDGKLTLGENIADNTGIRAAYQGYKLWVEKYGSENRLPGLEEYTSEQIFFISYAHLWCENIPIDLWVDRFANDPHASGHYRIVGSLANYEEFAEAFHCPMGEMRRGDKSCLLW